MSSKNSKAKKNKRPPPITIPVGGSNLIDKPQTVDVAGEIQTSINPNLARKCDTDQAMQDPRGKTKLRVEIATLIVVSAYTTVAFWQGCSTRELVQNAQNTYSAVDRPYIGLNTISVVFARLNDKGKIVLGSERSPDSFGMEVVGEIKNFGTVPGTNFDVNWRWLLNGKEIPHKKPIPAKKSMVFPNQSFGLHAQFEDSEYQAILAGAALTVEVRIRYDGPSGHYETCTRQQYDSGISAFADLGDSCGQTQQQ